MHCSQDPIAMQPGPEEFANLQGLLVQSSNFFGVSSVQFRSLGTSLTGKFGQFSSGYRGQVPPYSSFSSVHELFQPWMQPLSIFSTGSSASAKHNHMMRRKRRLGRDVRHRPPLVTINWSVSHLPAVDRLGTSTGRLAGDAGPQLSAAVQSSCET